MLIFAGEGKVAAHAGVLGQLLGGGIVLHHMPHAHHQFQIKVAYGAHLLPQTRRKLAYNRVRQRGR